MRIRTKTRLEIRNRNIRKNHIYHKGHYHRSHCQCSFSLHQSTLYRICQIKYSLLRTTKHQQIDISWNIYNPPLDLGVSITDKLMEYEDETFLTRSAQS